MVPSLWPLKLYQLDLNGESLRTIMSGLRIGTELLSQGDYEISQSSHNHR